MKIAVFEVEQWERDSLRLLQEDHEVTFSEERLTEDNAGGAVLIDTARVGR